MADKASDKKAKPVEKKTGGNPVDGIVKWLSGLLKNALIAFAIFVLLVFIAGQAFAYYAMKSGGAALMWVPIILLVAILFYKVLD